MGKDKTSVDKEYIDILIPLISDFIKTNKRYTFTPLLNEEQINDLKNLKNNLGTNTASNPIPEHGYENYMNLKKDPSLPFASRDKQSSVITDKDLRDYVSSLSLSLVEEIVHKIPVYYDGFTCASFVGYRSGPFWHRDRPSPTVKDGTNTEALQISVELADGEPTLFYKESDENPFYATNQNIPLDQIEKPSYGYGTLFKLQSSAGANQPVKDYGGAVHSGPYRSENQASQPPSLRLIIHFKTHIPGFIEKLEKNIFGTYGTEISPELKFYTGITVGNVAGKLIVSPALNYLNDKVTGQNSTKSFFDYYDYSTPFQLFSSHFIYSACYATTYFALGNKVGFSNNAVIAKISANFLTSILSNQSPDLSGIFSTLASTAISKLFYHKLGFDDYQYQPLVSGIGAPFISGIVMSDIAPELPKLLYNTAYIAGVKITELAAGLNQSFYNMAVRMEDSMSGVTNENGEDLFVATVIYG